MIALTLTACGGDDGSVPTGTSAVPTTQDGAAAGSGGEDNGGTLGGAGTATVTVSEGTFVLQVEEACLISDIGIGAVASSDEASLSLAGVEGAVNVGFELTSGDLWLVAAANIAVDGSTMSYSGPAFGPSGDTVIDLEVVCDELLSVPGG
jgi:hypothetical protein